MISEVTTWTTAPTIYTAHIPRMSKRKLNQTTSTNTNTALSHSSKRRLTTTRNIDTSSTSASASASSSTRNNNTMSVNETAAGRLFDEIADADDPTIATMEGICKLCEQLDIDPLEDIRILVLLHKMGADSKPAQITRGEWMQGCERMQVDSIAKLKNLLPGLDPGFMERAEFRNLYKFCFQFNRQGTHKTLEKDLASMLIELTLKNRIDTERLSSFVEFLSSTKDTSYDRITLDQWLSFYDFCIDCRDLSEYDEECSAWPVLIDDYVDFATSMKE